MRDFPQGALEPYNIEAQTPDAFVRYLLDLAPRHVVDTVREMSAGLVAPPLTVEDVLERLERGGLPRSVAEIRRLARA